MSGPSRRAAPITLAMLMLAAVGACTRDDPNHLNDTTSTSTSSSAASTSSGGKTTSSSTTTTTSSGAGTGGAGTGGAGAGGTGGVDPNLAGRVLSYTDALRSASFKIVGDAPTLDQITTLHNAADQKTTYEGMIDALLADPRFSARMVEFWQNAFRMRGAAAGMEPSRDAAPTFAARLTVTGGSFTDLLTATSNTCPTFDPSTNTFADGKCSNEASLAANNLTPVGVLTDPGVMALYFGNLAFRRQRFFHETFLCRKATDPVAEPTNMVGAGGPAGYASPWPWGSISGGPTAPIDFLHADPNGIICANCHATWNHRAPLWGNFDSTGQYTAAIAVHTPVVNLPLAVATDWLPATETTAWKYNQPAATLAELGTVMLADPEVRACAVARMWNYAMSRGDIVETGNKVSAVVTNELVPVFEANNLQLLPVVKMIFKHDDFVRF